MSVFKTPDTVNEKCRPKNDIYDNDHLFFLESCLLTQDGARCEELHGCRSALRGAVRLLVAAGESCLYLFCCISHKKTPHTYFNLCNPRDLSSSIPLPDIHHTDKRINITKECLRELVT